MTQLRVADHRRDSAGLTYVYPVLSRRTGGVSIGINLNPNNACNWRCIYCQVPNLQRGSAPPIDVAKLKDELSGLLHEVTTGEFFHRFDAPEEMRKVRDVAISGNGEPTSAREFPQVVRTIGEPLKKHGLAGRIEQVLITNGSLMDRPWVAEGLEQWGRQGGQVWFKLDRATAEGMAIVNGVHRSPEAALRDLQRCTALCPTWLQSALFALDGAPPSTGEQNAYLNLLAGIRRRGIELRGILLYGLARPTLQGESGRLSPLPTEWMEAWAERIRLAGFEVRLSR
jgi:wyosine [tRNA(Phe)-imidazoG37] synthetase (radical SAM superfamily)